MLKWIFKCCEKEKFKNNRFLSLVWQDKLKSGVVPTYSGLSSCASKNIFNASILIIKHINGGSRIMVGIQDCGH